MILERMLAFSFYHIAGSLGAFVGLYLSVLAPSKVILYLFAAVIVLIAILMMKRKSASQTQERSNLKELLEGRWHECLPSID